MINLSAASCLLFAVCCLLFSSCGYNDFGGYDDQPQTPVEYNIDVATLRSYYSGTPLVVDRQLTLRGSVTSSDRGNNFYRTLVIEDATGAIELMTGLYDMHNRYPVGQRVALRLDGLAIAMQEGVLRAGAPAAPGAYYPTEYLGQQPIVDRHLIREGIYAPLHPALLTIPRLSEAMCGRLVTIAGLRFIPETPLATWGNPSSNPVVPPTTGYRKFKSVAGDSIYVATSGYADFAADPVPQGTRLDITGILLRAPAPGTGGREVWMLKIRELDDVTQ